MVFGRPKIWKAVYVDVSIGRPVNESPQAGRKDCNTQIMVDEPEWPGYHGQGGYEAREVEGNGLDKHDETTGWRRTEWTGLGCARLMRGINEVDMWYVVW